MSAPEFYDDIKWLKTLFSIYHADLVQECTQGLLRRKRDDFVRSHKVWADTKEIGSLLHHINNEEQTSWYKAWFDGWYNLPLMIDNQVVCDSKFPKAIECIKRIKNVKIAGFSYLLPNAQIGNHQDSAGLITRTMAIHYCLTGEGELTVNNIVKKQFPGETIVFDSNYIHSAKEMLGKDRVILYIEAGIECIK